ncbi:hypothetical protein LEP1GSC050_3320 [Leptospira broomii serovar Hurstbridge str. 5399]|uniref:Uncharacterized protein n=1 Tax=Leptospira broomii serovar Hurstbridge str. 5399 TaxID=1049789 RepID=T0GF41_9LEPT|nr:hypothetical protein [Leptospira broomii]EQA44023.1 hypothetical protein LEP1GSC050_3320 [Leptospira broomii serovar Hurstbridge str. 5399]
MPEFDQIDLMNYAVYGNEHDPEWVEIRNYIRSNAGAQKEYEEMKRNLASIQPRRKHRESGRPQFGEKNPNDSQSGIQNPNDSDKKWWNVFLGD